MHNESNLGLFCEPSITEAERKPVQLGMRHFRHSYRHARWLGSNAKASSEGVPSRQAWFSTEVPKVSSKVGRRLFDVLTQCSPIGRHLFLTCLYSSAFWPLREIPHRCCRRALFVVLYLYIIATTFCSTALRKSVRTLQYKHSANSLTAP